MLNDMMDQWTIYKDGRAPPIGVDLVILVEHDVIFDKQKEFPFTRSCVVECASAVDSQLCWRLTDYDPEEEEEYLNWGEFTVIAWRKL